MRDNTIKSSHLVCEETLCTVDDEPHLRKTPLNYEMLGKARFWQCWISKVVNNRETKPWQSLDIYSEPPPGFSESLRNGRHRGHLGWLYGGFVTYGCWFHQDIGDGQHWLVTHLGRWLLKHELTNRGISAGVGDGRHGVNVLKLNLHNVRLPHWKVTNNELPVSVTKQPMRFWQPRQYSQNKKWHLKNSLCKNKPERMPTNCGGNWRRRRVGYQGKNPISGVRLFWGVKLNYHIKEYRNCCFCPTEFRRCASVERFGGQEGGGVYWSIRLRPNKVTWLGGGGQWKLSNYITYDESQIISRLFLKFEALHE